MQLLMLFIDSNTLHVSGVTCPSSGAQDTVCAARCLIHLSLILSLCLSRAVSVHGLVGPGLMCVGCPLGSVHYDCSGFYYFHCMMVTYVIIIHKDEGSHEHKIYLH